MRPSNLNNVKRKIQDFMVDLVRQQNDLEIIVESMETVDSEKTRKYNRLKRSYAESESTLELFPLIDELDSDELERLLSILLETKKEGWQQ